MPQMGCRTVFVSPTYKKNSKKKLAGNAAKSDKNSKKLY
jgi:hypothetical protein